MIFQVVKWSVKTPTIGRNIRPSNQQLLSQILPYSEMKLKVNIKMLFLSEENAAVMDTQVVK